VQVFRLRVKDAFAPQKAAPRDWLALYAPFMPLVDRSADAAVEEFLNSKPAFEARVQQILRYQRIGQQVLFDCASVARVGIFEVHAEQANGDLARRARAVADVLLASIATDVQVSATRPFRLLSFTPPTPCPSVPRPPRARMRSASG
jgi:dynein heavy chain